MILNKKQSIKAIEELKEIDFLNFYNYYNEENQKAIYVEYTGGAYWGEVLENKKELNNFKEKIKKDYGNLEEYSNEIKNALNNPFRSQNVFFKNILPIIDKYLLKRKLESKMPEKGTTIKKEKI